MGETLQGGSNVNPLALVFLLLMAMVMLSGRREQAVAAFLITAAFVPLGQQVVIARLHFHFFRLLILVGFIRLKMRGEMKGFRMTTIDKLSLYTALTGLVCGLLRDPNMQSLISNLGTAFNALGTYFLIRFLINDREQFVSHMRVLALIGAVVAVCMSLEMITHKNIFFIFGGVDEIVGERDGRFRCQGPFRNAILAGTFGATLFPLMIGLWFQRPSERFRALLGIAGAIGVTYASGSSGPLMSFLSVLIGFALWKWRYKMQVFRRGVVVMLIAFQLVMTAPVWFLIARISDLTGGTGWHRSYLIDQAIKHFSEWWMIGTSYTAHWAPAGQVLSINPNMMDITNHYVAQAIAGGIWQLVLFIATIVCCFKVIGGLVRSDSESNLQKKLLWTVGLSLTAHCVSFISISYFDQIEVFWFWLIAVIGTLSLPVKEMVESNVNEEKQGPSIYVSTAPEQA